VRRALIIFLAALLVSLLAAATMIGFAALTKSLTWSVVGAVLIAVLASWIVAILIWRRGEDRRSPLRRFVLGPLVVLGCAGLLSLTWLYPGVGGVRPDPIGGVEWLDAGHVAYIEQPALYTDLVRAFLTGEKLPLPTIDGTTIPDGYRGSS
jgi:Na+/proline symporter